MSWPVSIWPARDFAGAVGAQAHALRPVAVHAQPDALDVEHDVGHVLEHARQRGEFVQHALDLDRGDRRALQRGQQHAAQRIAERQAEAALERLGDNGGDPRFGSSPGSTASCFGLIRVLPILLQSREPRSGDARTGSANLAGAERHRSWRRCDRAGATGLRSDAAALGRPAAVMRDRRHVADRGDREADRLQGARAPIRGPNPDP